MSGKRGFMVTGPGVERPCGEDLGPALSYAITAASRHHSEATFYVRAPGGDIRGRVERDEDGHLAIYRLKGKTTC